VTSVCTLVLAWQVFDDAPIAAAANRDERVGRPSRPPAVIDEDPRVVAPSDEAAGGTWIGYNDAGLFVAITNRRREPATGAAGTALNFEADRSRGLLVRDALACESHHEAVSAVRDELAGREYDGFNLVIADAGDATLLEWDGVLRATHFDPGVHVVVNEGHDGAAPKAVRIREAVRPGPSDGATGDAARVRDAESGGGVSAWFETAKAVLRDHDLGACVHGDGYGTRSSSLVAIDSSGAGRYRFADGRPCETDYEVVEIGDGQL